MLRKLLKYEMMATARIFLPFFGALFILALINRVFFFMGAYNGVQAPQPTRVAAGLAMMVYVFAIFFIFILTFLVMVQRFYKNLLGDEGYLMFTLPVPAWKHIVSKMLISAFWLLVSTVLSLLSVAVLVTDHTFWSVLPLQVIEIFVHAYEVLGQWLWVYIVELCLAALLSLLSGILSIYAAVAIGQLWSQHRILGSFLAYIVLSTIMNSVASALFISVENWILKYAPDDGILQWHSLFGIIILIGALSLVGFFICTERLLSKRLNLQ